LLGSTDGSKIICIDKEEESYENGQIEGFCQQVARA